MNAFDQDPAANRPNENVACDSVDAVENDVCVRDVGHGATLVTVCMVVGGVAFRVREPSL